MPTRLIREGWIESAAIDALSVHAERFFLRLCLKADDYGRYHANEQLLKSNLFPLKEDVRNTDIARWLAECEAAGLVRSFSAQSKRFLEIPKFGQRVRAETSKFPSFDGHLPDIGRASAHVGGDEVGVGAVGGLSARAGIPTIEEAKELAIKLGMPDTEGEDFWHHYQGQGWVTGSGLTITDWKAALHKWKTRWERNSVSVVKNEASAKINSVAQADSVIAECEDEIARIKRDPKNQTHFKDQYEIMREKLTSDAQREVEIIQNRITEVRKIKRGLK